MSNQIEDSHLQLLPHRKSSTSIKFNNAKVQLAWKDIFIESNPRKGCFGKTVGKHKVILDNVSGCVMPGQFLSIIGASGAGKTTLLNYLSGRLISKGLNKQGTVLINGVDRNEISKF
jgi:ABC-type multidrug transport system fused ATPase/permease subunit